MSTITKSSCRSSLLLGDESMRCILCDGRIIYKGPPDENIQDSYRQHLCKFEILHTIIKVTYLSSWY